MWLVSILLYFGIDSCTFFVWIGPLHFEEKNVISLSVSQLQGVKVSKWDPITTTSVGCNPIPWLYTFSIAGWKH